MTRTWYEGSLLEISTTKDIKFLYMNLVVCQWQTTKFLYKNLVCELYFVGDQKTSLIEMFLMNTMTSIDTKKYEKN